MLVGLALCLLPGLFMVPTRAMAQDPVCLVALPQLTPPISLRILQVINPRFEAASPTQLTAILSTAAQTVRDQFDIEVTFERARSEPVAEFFALDKLSARARRNIASGTFDFKSGRDDSRGMTRGFLRQLQREGESYESLHDYALPNLIAPPRGRTLPALVDALVDTQLRRLADWRTARGPDGQPIIDHTPYNEYLVWDALAHAGFAADVVITNQLIASAERFNNSVHTALRGGITAGITSPNPMSRLGTSSVVSTYPMMARDETLRLLRGGETYGEDDAARFAGLILAHELGHQLFHYGHPFGEKACVMSPTPLLRFRDWAAALSGATCRATPHPAMRPGAAKIDCGTQ